MTSYPGTWRRTWNPHVCDNSGGVSVKWIDRVVVSGRDDFHKFGHAA
ncbi:MAG TPA: hypothetical protein VFT47_19685 [Vicinamibacterales bacterium]|nr:hypothetical protein [Vicinamibacterales bacterium]